jgi:hypothetical protein
MSDMTGKQDPYKMTVFNVTADTKHNSLENVPNDAGLSVRNVTT